MNFVLVSRCLIQSEVKKTILVKSNLCEVRFNPREMILREVMSHQCDYSLLDISMFINRQTTAQKLFVSHFIS